MLRAPSSPHSPRQGPQVGQAPPAEKGQSQGWVRDPPGNSRSPCATCYNPRYRRRDTVLQPMRDPPSLLGGQWVPVAPTRGDSVSPGEEEDETPLLVPPQSQTHFRTLDSRRPSNSWQPLGTRSRNADPGGQAITANPGWGWRRSQKIRI